ncbi:unnamed protein product, partial [marine sediment metagenome]
WARYNAPRFLIESSIQAPDVGAKQKQILPTQAAKTQRHFCVDGTPAGAKMVNSRE